METGTRTVFRPGKLSTPIGIPIRSTGIGTGPKDMHINARRFPIGR